jgi:hypothetical protein
LSVIDFGKNKLAHYGYVGSLLLNLYLATGDRQVRDWSEELMDISIERMRDRGGWFYGFRSTFDRQWRRTPFVRSGCELAATGAQLTAALALARLHEQTGQVRFRDAVLELSKSLTAAAWNEKTGAWRDSIIVQDPSRVAPPASVSWWVQIYGSLLEMHCTISPGTGFISTVLPIGGLLQAALPDPRLGGHTTKWTPREHRRRSEQSVQQRLAQSYHELEHALLNYIHLNLYVHRTTQAVSQVHDARPRAVPGG